MRMDPTRWCWATLSLPLLVVSACEAPPREVAFPAEDRTAVRAVMDGLGERLIREDLQGARNLFQEDALLLPPPGPPMEGMDDIDRALEARATGVVLDSASLSTDPVDGGAGVAYAWGTYEGHLMADPPGGEAVDWMGAGSWLAVLLRNGVAADEGWRIHRLIWNLDASPLLPDDLPDPPSPTG